MKMSIDECMQKHSERQARLWMIWFCNKLDKSEKIDYYLMQIAAEIRRGIVKNPSSVNVDSFKIKFKTSNNTSRNKDKNIDKDNENSKINLSKSIWLGSMSGAIEYKGKKASSKEIMNEIKDKKV